MPGPRVAVRQREVSERHAGQPVVQRWPHILEEEPGRGNGEDEGVVAGERRRGLVRLVIVGVPGPMGESTPKHE
jgi:hypothetical protein